MSAQEIHRACRTCMIEKPVGDFAKNKKSSGGRRHKCKSCANTELIKWRMAHGHNTPRPKAAQKKEKDPRQCACGSVLLTNAHRCKPCSRARCLEKTRKRADRKRNEIDSWYVARLLINTHGWTRQQLKDHPEVVQLKQAILTIKRHAKHQATQG